MTVASSTKAKVIGTMSMAPFGLRVASRATRSSRRLGFFGKAKDALTALLGGYAPEPHRRSTRWHSLDRPASGHGDFGSFGRPNTRSPTMLRWISAVPPQIVSDREKKNDACK